MSSTRNRNTTCDYAIERARDEVAEKYTGLVEFSRAAQPCRPGNGLLPGQMHYDDTDANGVDVESFLRGIRATDLTGPSHTAAPNPNTLQWLCVYPTRAAPYLPTPVNVTGDERHVPS
jgi:hypothetical protein